VAFFDEDDAWAALREQLEPQGPRELLRADVAHMTDQEKIVQALKELIELIQVILDRIDALEKKTG